MFVTDLFSVGGGRGAERFPIETFLQAIFLAPILPPDYPFVELDCSSSDNFPKHVFKIVRISMPTRQEKNFLLSINFCKIIFELTHLISLV